MAEGCKGCIHWRRFIANSTTMACHYCIDTGLTRDCEPEECTHYNSSRASRKKLLQAQREETFGKAFGKMGERKSFCYRFRRDEDMRYK